MDRQHLRIWISVGRNVLIWLGFNLGVQLLPVAYLWIHAEDKHKAFHEYVNCTAVLLVAVGMLFAAVSDIITEGHWRRVGVRGALAIILIAFFSLAELFRGVHDEFLLAGKADFEVLCMTSITGLAIVLCGTFLKADIWYNEAVLGHR